MLERFEIFNVSESSSKSIVPLKFIEKLFNLRMSCSADHHLLRYEKKLRVRDYDSYEAFLQSCFIHIRIKRK